MTPSTYRPKVSIVMSFCNEPLQWIRFAVESIMKQTFTDFEVIIVCDNPKYTEGIEYIKGLSDGRIKLLLNQKNLGPTKSFNTGISASCGEYIAKMDADDISLAERLAKQVEYLDAHPEISVCATDVHRISPEGKIIRRNRYRNKRDQSLLLIQNCIAHPSVMYRRSLLELRDPLYNEDFKYAQDYELWQFLTLKGCRLHTLEEALLLYRNSPQQISRAKRSTQAGFFKKAHKAFVTQWLISHYIIDADDTSDLKVMLAKCSHAYSSCSDNECRKNLAHIIYVLYFALGTGSPGYRLRYLFDRNLIAFHHRFVYSFRLLFSRKSRHNRNGFI